MQCTPATSDNSEPSPWSGRIRGGGHCAVARESHVCDHHSELRFVQNVSETKRATGALKAINPSIPIAGEIGEMETGSEIQEEAPQGLTLTTPEEAREFAAATRIDIQATAVGNANMQLFHHTPPN